MINLRNYTTRRFTILAVLVIMTSPIFTEETELDHSGLAVQPEEKPWQGKIGFGYSLSYPEADSSVKQDSSVSYNDKVNTVRLGSQMVGIMKNGNITNFNGVFNAGYDRYFIRRVELFSFANYESKVILSIQNKFIAGGGAKYIWLKGDLVTFDTSLAPVYVRTLYFNTVDKSDFSVSMRVRLKFAIHPQLSFAIPYFFVADVQDHKNQWHSLDPSLSYKISILTDLTAGYRYRYNLFNDAAAGLAYLVFAFKFKA